MRELFEIGRSDRVRTDLQHRALVRSAAIYSAATLEALNQPGLNSTRFAAGRGATRSTSTGPGASLSNGAMDGPCGSTSSNTIEAWSGCSPRRNQQHSGRNIRFAGRSSGLHCIPLC
jgi:hypothetical protein